MKLTKGKIYKFTPNYRHPRIGSKLAVPKIVKIEDDFNGSVSVTILFNNKVNDNIRWTFNKYWYDIRKLK